MNTLVKWAGAGLVATVLLGFTGVSVGERLAGQKAARMVQLDVEPVAFVDDAESIERGKYLYLTRGCTDCHGTDASGREVIHQDGMHIRGPNLTLGRNSGVRGYDERAWVRSIRHGVAPDGRPLIFMPSEDYNRMSDDDLADMVAYLRSLDPVDGEPRVVQLSQVARLLYATGVLQDASEKIDHALAPEPKVTPAPSAAYGAYLINMCKGCHGAGLSGGKIPGTPPDFPSAANLTPSEGGVMLHYDDARALGAMFRSGKRPDGSPVSPMMPFEALGKLDDVEVAALYAYLQTVAPRDAGTR